MCEGMKPGLCNRIFSTDELHRRMTSTRRAVRGSDGIFLLLDRATHVYWVYVSEKMPT